MEGKDERKFIDLEREFLFAAQSREMKKKVFLSYAFEANSSDEDLSESNFDSPGLWLFNIPLT